MNSGITATAGLVVGVISACIWIFGKQALPRMVMLGTVTLGVGIAGTSVGGWLHSGVTLANNQIGKLVGGLLGRPDLTTPGTVVWSIGAMVLAFWLGFAFKHREIDLKALAGTALLPYAIATVPGGIGESGQTLLKTVAAVVAWPVTQLLGL